MATTAMMVLPLLLCLAVAFWRYRIILQRLRRASAEHTGPSPKATTTAARASHGSPDAPELSWPELSEDQNATWPELEHHRTPAKSGTDSVTLNADYLLAQLTAEKEHKRLAEIELERRIEDLKRELASVRIQKVARGLLQRCEDARQLEAATFIQRSGGSMLAQATFVTQNERTGPSQPAPSAQEVALTLAAPAASAMPTIRGTPAMPAMPATPAVPTVPAARAAPASPATASPATPAASATQLPNSTNEEPALPPAPRSSPSTSPWFATIWPFGSSDDSVRAPDVRVDVAAPADIADYLSDPRMRTIPFTKLKLYIAAQDSSLRMDAFQCSTKAALILLAKKHRINLDALFIESPLPRATPLEEGPADRPTAIAAERAAELLAAEKIAAAKRDAKKIAELRDKVAGHSERRAKEATATKRT